MNPDRILQSDVLDIVFENRNKFYGAYELRRNYNARLKTAIGFTLFTAALFIGIQSLHLKKSITETPFANKFDSLKFTTVNIADPKPQPQQIMPLKNKPVATITYKTPTIVEDNKVRDTVHTIAAVLNTKIAGSDVKGENVGDKIVLPAANGALNGDAGLGVKKEPVVDDRPLATAEVMPQFPGGINALIKFLQQNLRQPDDLEEGQKLLVIANFIIDAAGNIQNIRIEQRAREDLDADVVRVLKRMPQWQAGMQNGRKVSVIYRLPVTFIAHD